MSTRRDFLLAAGAGFTFGRSVAAEPAAEPIVVVSEAPPVEWETASPESHGMSPADLTAALQSGDALEPLRSVVVVRHGMLMAERYYGGAQPGDLLAINSVTKSVSSMLVGLALQRKTIASLQATVGQLIPEALRAVPDSPVADVTLEQILTGRTGSEYPWQEYLALFNAADPVAFALSRPRGKPSASGWTYNDAMVSLLSAILAKAEGLELSALAARDLFMPLGIHRFAWRRDANGNATAYAGLALRTRDLAKLAWLMANQGQWRGRSVLPAGWVRASLERRGPADWRVAPVTNIGYGYLWFTGTLHQHAIAWGWGYGGQFALTVPALGLVIATAAVSPPPEKLLTQTNAIMALVGRIVQTVRT